MRNYYIVYSTLYLNQIRKATITHMINPNSLMYAFMLRIATLLNLYAKLLFIYEILCRRLVQFKDGIIYEMICIKI